MVAHGYSGNTLRKLKLRFFIQCGLKIERLAKILYSHSTAAKFCEYVFASILIRCLPAPCSSRCPNCGDVSERLLWCRWFSLTNWLFEHYYFISKVSIWITSMYQLCYNLRNILTLHSVYCGIWYSTAANVPSVACKFTNRYYFVV